MLLTMESKTAAASKLEELILRGRTKGGEVIAHVMNNQPLDRLQTGDSFEAEGENGLQIRYADFRQGMIQQPLHRHAVRQMASTAELPMKFIDGLQNTPEFWAKELLAHDLQTVFSNRYAKDRYLLRSIHGELRGFLSDRFRRLDSRPIVEAFAKAVQEKGATVRRLCDRYQNRYPGNHARGLRADRR